MKWFNHFFQRYNYFPYLFSWSVESMYSNVLVSPSLQIMHNLLISLPPTHQKSLPFSSFFNFIIISMESLIQWKDLISRPSKGSNSQGYAWMFWIMWLIKAFPQKKINKKNPFLEKHWYQYQNNDFFMILPMKFQKLNIWKDHFYSPFPNK